MFDSYATLNKKQGDTMSVKTTLALTIGCTALLFSNTGFSDHLHCLSKVSMSFNAEHWLNSSSSEVTVNINASAPADKTDDLTETFKSKLSKITDSQDWQITDVNRSESDSGLIKLSAKASARVENNQLGELQQKLNTLNTPGEQYKIVAISTQAELTSINKLKAELRNELYQQIKNGLQELNAAKLSREAQYTIYKIKFNDVTMPRPVSFAVTTTKNTRQASNVADKLQMSAKVTYGICPFPQDD